MKTIEQARGWLSKEVKRRELELFAYSKALELASKNKETGFLLQALNNIKDKQVDGRVTEVFREIMKRIIERED